LNRSISEVPVRLTLFQKTPPYWFQLSQYEMHVPKLQAQLTLAKLVLGDVAATVGDFFEGYRPAPVGAIFNDLDLYTSMRDSPKLLDNAPEFSFRDYSFTSMIW